jgi:hypothetical protein
VAQHRQGDRMSTLQRDLAITRIMMRAKSKMKDGWDSMTVHLEALRELDRLALNVSDLRFYKRELSKVTGIK